MQAIGIVGVGGFAATHIRAITHGESIGICRLEAAVIRTQDRDACIETETDLLARGVRIYRRYEEMYAAESGRISVVCNPTGIPEHEQLTVDAFAAGFNVICEKPLTGTFDSALRMLAAEQSGGRLSAIGFQDVFSPLVRRIKEITLAGSLGRLTSARTCYLCPRSSAYYTRHGWAGKMEFNGKLIHDSLMQNAGAHYLQNMLYVAGPDTRSAAWPVQVYGENYRAKDITGADTQCLEVEVSGGVKIFYVGSHSTTVKDGPVTEFTYENGRILWRIPERRATVFSKDGVLVEEIADGRKELYCIPFDEVLNAFSENLEPAATIANSMQHTLAIDAMFRSSAGSAAIDPEHVERIDVEPERIGMASGPGRAVNVVIRDIESVVKRSFDCMQPFSAMDVPWARPSRRIVCRKLYPLPGNRPSPS